MTLPFGQLSFPELYERELVAPLFRPWAELVLDDVQLSVGDRLLDIACGTGIVARVAKERLGNAGSVVGVDLSPAMLDVARGLVTGIDWRQGDACALPLKVNEQFDVVVCQQGLQFCPDKRAAVRELRRALAARGRVAVSTWRPDEELPLLRELRRVAEQHAGAIVDRRHSCGEAGPLELLLRDASFRDVRSKTVSRTIRFENGPLFVRLNAMALVGMSAASKGMSDEDRGQLVEAITRDSAEVIRPYTDETGLTFELRANVVMARD